MVIAVVLESLTHEKVRTTVSCRRRCGECSRMAGLARFLPYALAFLSSLCIMILELVSSRLVAPHVGQSLTVWTSVIGIILAGICLGNVLGGRLADRVEPRRAVGPLFALGLFSHAGRLWVNAEVGHSSIPDEMNWELRTVIVVIARLPDPGDRAGHDRAGRRQDGRRAGPARRAARSATSISGARSVRSSAHSSAVSCSCTWRTTSTIVLLVAAALAVLAAALIAATCRRACRRHHGLVAGRRRDLPAGERPGSGRA